MYASFVIKYNYEKRQWMIEIRIFCRQFDTNNYNYERRQLDGRNMRLLSPIRYNYNYERRQLDGRNMRLLSSIRYNYNYERRQWMVELRAFCRQFDTITTMRENSEWSKYISFVSNSIAIIIITKGMIGI